MIKRYVVFALALLGIMVTALPVQAQKRSFDAPAIEPAPPTITVPKEKRPFDAPAIPDTLLPRFTPDYLPQAVLPFDWDKPIKTKQWCAIAWGNRETKAQSYISVVSSCENKTQEAAVAAAIKGCQNPDVPNCQLHTAYNSGCAYYTVGKSEKIGHADWGYGLTSDAALKNCQSRAEGIECETSVRRVCVR